MKLFKSGRKNNKITCLLAGILLALLASVLQLVDCAAVEVGENDEPRMGDASDMLADDSSGRLADLVAYRLFTPSGGRVRRHSQPVGQTRIGGKPAQQYPLSLALTNPKLFENDALKRQLPVSTKPAKSTHLRAFFRAPPLTHK